MAGGLVNRSTIGRLAPQPQRQLGLQQPAGGAYNGQGALPRTNVGVAPRQPFAGGLRAAQAPAMAARSAKPAWLDATYLADLAGLRNNLTQTTSPIREQLSQFGFSTGGFTPYQAAVRDIGQNYLSSIYGMGANQASRGLISQGGFSGANTTGATKLGLERSTNLANANQEMGPAAIARLRRQIAEARQGFNQSRLAARAQARERLMAKHTEAQLSKDTLAALAQQYPGVSMAQVKQAINANRGGAKVSLNGQVFNSFKDLRDNGLHNQYHGLRKAAWQHLVNRDMARAQGNDLGSFTLGGATFTIGSDGQIRKQQQNYGQMQGPVFGLMGTRG